MSASQTIWINAGEMSGDMHGGKLISALHAQSPDLRFIGMGGPDMRANGLRALQRVEDLSVMGVTEVLGHLPRIFKMLRQIQQALKEHRPQAVVLIDAPEFNFRVAKYAYNLGIPVYYYISPKLWAWRTERAKFIAKYVTRMISILPFEVDFYKQFGMDIDYVGNPLVDMVDWETIESILPNPLSIGLLPGSRKKEIEPLMPEFAKAAEIIAARHPQIQFHCIQAPGIAPDKLQELWKTDIPLTLHTPENRYAFMRSCNLMLAASGTVTLEAALIGTPTIVTYKLSDFSYAIAKRVIKVQYASLPNLIMNREVFPELLQKNANGTALAQTALNWLETEGKLPAIRRELQELREKLGEKGAAERAAAIILQTK